MDLWDLNLDPEVSLCLPQKNCSYDLLLFLSIWITHFCEDILYRYLSQSLNFPLFSKYFTTNISFMSRFLNI